MYQMLSKHNMDLLKGNIAAHRILDFVPKCFARWERNILMYRHGSLGKASMQRYCILVRSCDLEYWFPHLMPLTLRDVGYVSNEELKYKMIFDWIQGVIAYFLSQWRSLSRQCHYRLKNSSSFVSSTHSSGWIGVGSWIGGCSSPTS